MAIDYSDPTLSRSMFQNGIPGVNPAQFGIAPMQINPNTGGILQNVRGSAPPVIAAQPLQVASADSGMRSTGSGRFVDWLSQFYPNQDLSDVPLDTMIDSYNRRRSLVTGNFDFATGRAPKWVVPEGYGLAEDGTIIPIDPAASAAAAEPIPVAGEPAGELVRVTQGEPAGEPDDDLAGLSDENLQLINAAAENETINAVARGEVDAGGADVLGGDAQALASTLLSEAADETDFQSLIAALGPNNITDYSQYNEQAKQLLGIDEDESDVPDWAAPMFLFGLNLMQGPVSSKIQGQGLLGGLLSDVGAAGEKGFAFFAAERGRKRKEKAQIATVSMQLQEADTAQRKLLVDAYAAGRKVDLDLTEAASLHFDKVLGRIYGLVGTGTDAESQRQRLTAANSVFQNIVGLQTLGVSGEALMGPQYTSFLIAHAAKEMGVRAPELKLETKTVVGVDYTYDPKALQAAWVKYNKDNPNAPLAHPSQLFGMIVVDDPRIQTDYYRMLVSGARTPESSFTSQTRIGGNGEKITDDLFFDETAFNNWSVKFERTNNRPPNPTEVRDSLPQFRGVVNSYLTDNPKMVQGSFTDENQVKHDFYYNPVAFANLRRSNTSLTLEKVLRNQGAYPNIISGETKDLSGLAPNMTTTTVGMGDGGKTKRVFSYDKNTFGRAMRPTKDANGQEIPAAIQPTDDLIEKMIELGIGNWAGEKWSTTEPSTMTYVGADGSVIAATGEDAQGMITGFGTAKAEEEWKGQTLGLVSLHRLSHQIDPLLRQLSGERVASTILEIGNFFESGTRIITGLFGGEGSSSQMNGFASGGTKKIRFGEQTVVNDLTERGREELTAGLDVLRSGKLLFGGVAITEKKDRARVESMFVNLAFALASAREGGKLTDNDVKNALLTLGWDGSSFSQTPEAVLSTLSGAVQDASNAYFEEAVYRMNDDQRMTHAATIAAGGGNVVETLLRTYASQSDPVDTSTPMYNLYRAAEEADGQYRLQYHLQEQDERTEGQTGAPPPANNQQSFTYGGTAITYAGEPLSQEEAATLNLLGNNNVGRTVAAVQVWFETLSKEQKGIYAPIIKSLKQKNFFATGGSQ